MLVDGSLHKICHYQQNVMQHHYLLDTRSGCSIVRSVVWCEVQVN